MIQSINEYRKVYEAEKKKPIYVVKPGKMHKALGIAKDKKIENVYKSGKKLAEDLVAKVGKKSATKMLNFAANTNKDITLYSTAVKALDKIDESNINENVESENTLKLLKQCRNATPKKLNPSSFKYLNKLNGRPFGFSFDGDGTDGEGNYAYVFIYIENNKVILSSNYNNNIIYLITQDGYIIDIKGNTMDIYRDLGV